MVLGQRRAEVSTGAALILPVSGSSSSLRSTRSWLRAHPSPSTHLWRTASNLAPDKTRPGPWQRLLQLINGAMRANEAFLPSLLELRKSDACCSKHLVTFWGFSSEFYKLQVAIKDLEISKSR